MIELLSLFTLAFLAATVLPSFSEIYLISLLDNDDFSEFLLVAVATSGNVLGAVVNWFLGRYMLHFQDRKWFPLKENQLAKATIFYNKWGVWSLLLSWMPLIGDALTFVAGVFKANIWLFLLLVTIGKTCRYLAVLFVVNSL